jgi:glycosyltransferase involved in cell wall biosynthesis
MSRFNVGGTSQWLFQLSQGLSEIGIDNLLVIGDCPKSELEDSRLMGISHQRVKGLGPKVSIYKATKGFFELRKVIKEFKPDIVNTHTSKAGVIGRIATFSLRKRPVIVHTYHGHVLSGYFNPLIEGAVKRIEILLSFITDYFLVSGERVLNDISKARIIRGEKALQIWPAVPDLKVGERKALRLNFDISDNKLVVGWLGRKVPIKRVDRILALAGRNPEITFLLAGDGASIRSQFTNLFKDGALKNVIEAGFMTPSDIWAISDICLITSDNEAMPISPIEAALASRPIIATDAGATREVLVDGKTGILCSRDIADLASALNKLSIDSSLREEMGRAGRQFVLKKFAPKASVERQLEGYRLALAKRLGD